MLRDYIAKKPRDLMDKIQKQFVSEFGQLIGDCATIAWDKNVTAAKQLITWAEDKDVIKDARSLTILLENAQFLGQEKKK
jgi:hypothetical protein